jgi:hypothetical protein
VPGAKSTPGVIDRLSRRANAQLALSRSARRWGSSPPRPTAPTEPSWRRPAASGRQVIVPGINDVPFEQVTRPRLIFQAVDDPREIAEGREMAERIVATTLGVLAGLGMIVPGCGYLLGQPWWPYAALASAAISLVLLLLTFTPWWVPAVAIDIGIGLIAFRAIKADQ